MLFTAKSDPIGPGSSFSYGTSTVATPPMRSETDGIERVDPERPDERRAGVALVGAYRRLKPDAVAHLETCDAGRAALGLPCALCQAVAFLFRLAMQRLSLSPRPVRPAAPASDPRS